MDSIGEDEVVVARLAPSARTGERRAEWRAAPSGREAATSRIARAVAGADAGAVVGGAACAWLALRARAAATRAATWERRARNAEAANQELEWRLRVATANGGGKTTGSRSPSPDPPTPRRETSTPKTRAKPSSASTKDVRDVVIEGLRLETEALKSALAAARAETRAVMASNFANDAADAADDDDR